MLFMIFRKRIIQQKSIIIYRYFTTLIVTSNLELLAFLQDYLLFIYYEEITEFM
jgi:hypothetical protein